LSVSTYGEGEAPDNAARFEKAPAGIGTPDLSGLEQYHRAALGDSPLYISTIATGLGRTRPHPTAQPAAASPCSIRLRL